MDPCAQCDDEVARLERNVQQARAALERCEDALAAARVRHGRARGAGACCVDGHAAAAATGALTNAEIARYSRHLIMPEFGPRAQRQLRSASVLVVGAGGLGSPVILYLAAAGVGRLGIVDDDCVEESNLQRQVVHREASIGTGKAESAADAARAINRDVRVTTHAVRLVRDNALSIIGDYDVVADCTDNVQTRYLVNDACVVAGRPLVTAAVLRMEGQLATYNCDGGPCYRCVFPQPPLPQTVGTCADSGVFGVVCGVVGCMQALDATRIAAGLGSIYAGRLVLFDGTTGQCRNVRLRGRRPDCVMCSRPDSADRVLGVLDDATETCSTPPMPLAPEQRIDAAQYAHSLRHAPHALVDVRPAVEFEICALPGSVSVPITDLEAACRDAAGASAQRALCVLRDALGAAGAAADAAMAVVVVCKRGNDSQSAVRCLDSLALRGLLPSPIVAKDIVGGLRAWADDVDAEFPVY